MRCVAICLFPLLMFLLCGCSSNKEKIQGTWELESGFQSLTECTWEYTHDGKVKLEGKLAGQPFSDEGTYAINGNVMTCTMNLNKETRSTRILELTDTKLVLKDEGAGENKKVVFKRKK